MSGLEVRVPDGTYEHGTYAKYTLERCRCTDCRAAVAAYRRQHVKNKLFGKAGNVDAEPVRAHVRKLKAAGLGYKKIAELAGLNPKTVNTLFRGRPERGTPPPSQIRKTTADKLMAVRPKIMSPKQCVPALPFWFMVADMMELGYSKKWIAEQLGHKNALQIGRDNIHAQTAHAIASLHAVTKTGRKATSPRLAPAISRAINDGEKLRRHLEARQRARKRSLPKKLETFDRKGQGSRNAA
jgi:DNA-binding CsgD family transcriptional regulator